MGISLKTHKLLWGRSGNQCAICKNYLIVDSTDPNDDPSIVGDEAHIIARNEFFTRGDYDSLPAEDRDQYSNLILLCKTHHKQIDDQPAYFTVERLREIKAAHEQDVKSSRTGPDEKHQEDDILYSGYIDEWQKRADLDNWRSISSDLTSGDAPTLPRRWYEDQKEFLIWIIGRIWPQRYHLLEEALLNYKTVVQDFLNAFDRHADFAQEDAGYLYTRKFYKIREWDPERYARLAEQFDEHVNLVCDLFFELTRAANYVCDRVREFLFHSYRLHEGVLLVERHNVGFKLKTVHNRVEYRGDERTARPYPGLKRFKKIRYKRDLAIDPNPPGPPTNIDEDA